MIYSWQKRPFFLWLKLCFFMTIYKIMATKCMGQYY